MEEAEFTLAQAKMMIWWLTKIAGGRVTIPMDDQFWDANLPPEHRLLVDHDADGNPVLVAYA